VPWAAEDFATWLLVYAYGAEAARLVARVCANHHLPPAVADDLRQEWVLSLLRTAERRLPEWIETESEARAYALRALPNRAIEFTRRGRRDPEPLEPREQALGGATLPWHQHAGPPTDDHWCEHTRRHVTTAFHDGAITCSGCPAPRVVSIALWVIAAVCDEDDARGLPAWAAEIKGGTTEFDQLVYQALVHDLPEQYVRDDSGRFPDSARKRKERCGRCVRELLVDASAGSHTGDAGSAGQL
jgi:hypothetical protein